MFTAWIRSISAPLVAVCALSIVSGSIAPVAQAAPNTGNNSVKLSAKECQVWKDLANSDSDNAAEAYEKGDKAAGKSYSLQADSDYEFAHQGGCGGPLGCLLRGIDLRHGLFWARRHDVRGVQRRYPVAMIRWRGSPRGLGMFTFRDGHGGLDREQRQRVGGAGPGRSRWIATRGVERHRAGLPDAVETPLTC